MGHLGSGVCGSKLCRIKLVTLQETIKLGTVPPGQAGSLAHVPMGDFQEPHEVLLLEVVLGPIWVWLARGERPATGTLVGGAVVLLAVLVQLLPSGAEESALEYPR